MLQTEFARKLRLFCEKLRLFRLIWDDEQDFDGDGLAALFGGAELPLTQGFDPCGGLGELLGKNDFELLEMAIFVDEAVEDDGVGIDVSGIEGGTGDFVGPGSVDVAFC